MNAESFLQAVTPAAGYIVIATPRNNTKGRFNHQVFDAVPNALEYAEQVTFDRRDAYFALASFNEKLAVNPRTGKKGIRFQANAQSMRCLFMDLDVKPERPDSAFASKQEAINDLMLFAAKLHLPAPITVDSGGGIHAYWPFDEDVAAASWVELATRFKAIAQAEELRTDYVVMADCARILRLPGSYNFKYQPERLVRILTPETTALPFAEYQRLLSDYAKPLGNGHALTLRTAPAATTVLGDNLGTTNEPVNFDRISFECPQVLRQIAVRGAEAPEPLWRAMLGLAKFAYAPQRAMLAVSDGYANFKEPEALAKMNGWATGPSTCASIDSTSPGICQNCAYFGKITSPAQLGRDFANAPSPVAVINMDIDGEHLEETVLVPNPPNPYFRTQDGRIVIRTESEAGIPISLSVSPNDLYPMKIMRPTSVSGIVVEQTLWRMHLHRHKTVDVMMPNGILADKKLLHKFMLDNGIYPTGTESGALQLYMSAYLKHLSQTKDREIMFERCGWHENHTAFVVGPNVVRPDKTDQYSVSRSVANITKDSLRTKGTIEGWKAAIEFYNRPGCEGPRFFMYCSLAAPLLHMTGHKGVTVTASGDTGRGKTTTLRACASMWGNSESMLVNGNRQGTTTNALYEIIGCYHSLPVFWDDTTQRDPLESRDFLLNISQGKGKERMKGSEHDGRTVTWETFVLSSNNNDDISRIANVSKNSAPQLMRLFGVEFSLIDTSTETKILADTFLRGIEDNYGHVGVVFMEYIVKHYDAVKARVVANMAAVDRIVHVTPEERFWTATIAVALTAGQLAKHLGLLNFPIDADIKWMIDHINTMRNTMATTVSQPNDILAEFLEDHIGATLVISTTQTRNLDNIALPPRGPKLLVRHELDAHTLYVSRTAIMDYCAEKNANFRKLEDGLAAAGIVTHTNLRRTLGADTIYAKGQVACWRIDDTKLAGFTQVIEAAINQGGH